MLAVNSKRDELVSLSSDGPAIVHEGILYAEKAITIPTRGRMVVFVKVPGANNWEQDILIISAEKEESPKEVWVREELRRTTATSHVAIRLLNSSSKPLQVPVFAPLARFFINPKVDEARDVKTIFQFQTTRQELNLTNTVGQLALVIWNLLANPTEGFKRLNNQGAAVDLWADERRKILDEPTKRKLGVTEFLQRSPFELGHILRLSGGARKRRGGVRHHKKSDRLRGGSPQPTRLQVLENMLPSEILEEAYSLLSNVLDEVGGAPLVLLEMRQLVQYARVMLGSGLPTEVARKRLLALDPAQYKDLAKVSIEALELASLREDARPTNWVEADESFNASPLRRAGQQFSTTPTTQAAITLTGQQFSQLFERLVQNGPETPSQAARPGLVATPGASQDAIPASAKWYVPDINETRNLPLRDWTLIINDVRPIQGSQLEKALGLIVLHTIFRGLLDGYKPAIGVPLYANHRNKLLIEMVRLFTTICAARGPANADDTLLSFILECKTALPRLDELVLANVAAQAASLPADEALKLIMQRFDEVFTVRSEATLALSFGEGQKWKIGQKLDDFVMRLIDEAVSCFPNETGLVRRGRAIEAFLRTLRMAADDPGLRFSKANLAALTDRWPEVDLLEMQLETLVLQMRRHPVGSMVLEAAVSAPSGQRRVNIVDEGPEAYHMATSEEDREIYAMRVGVKPALNYLMAAKEGAIGDIPYAMFDDPSATDSEPVQGLSDHLTCPGCILHGVTERLTRAQMLKARLEDRNFRLGDKQCTMHRPHRCPRLKAHLEAWVQTEEGAPFSDCLKDCTPSEIKAAEKAAGFSVVTFAK